MIPILDELKEKVQGWDLSVKVRNEARLAAKDYVKQSEKDLKSAKRVLYLTTKQWRYAREELKIATGRFKRYPSYKRQWAKKNMGKVMDMIDKQNSEFCDVNVGVSE